MKFVGLLFPLFILWKRIDIFSVFAIKVVPLFISSSNFFCVHLNSPFNRTSFNGCPFLTIILFNKLTFSYSPEYNTPSSINFNFKELAGKINSLLEFPEFKRGSSPS
ncbi:hypothetical protein, partial [Neisseria sicca]|uniref:hypothetical protein n=1 Tax=Neisseria sicca TaxID=490 RepID=UPI003C76F557